MDMRVFFFYFRNILKKTWVIILLLFIAVICFLFILLCSLNAIDTIKYSIQENIFLKKTLITMVIVFFSIVFLFITARDLL